MNMCTKIKLLRNSLVQSSAIDLDGVITFASLGKPVMMKIVGKFLVELKDMVKDKAH